MPEADVSTDLRGLESPSTGKGKPKAAHRDNENSGVPATSEPMVARNPWGLVNENIYNFGLQVSCETGKFIPVGLARFLAARVYGAGKHFAVVPSTHFFIFLEISFSTRVQYPLYSYMQPCGIVVRGHVFSPLHSYV